MQEFRAERADDAIRELNRQKIIFIVWKIYPSNQKYEASRREQSLLRAEIQNHERAQQDDRSRTVRDMEELEENLLF